MNKIKYLFGLLLTASLCACNGWLDVKPKTQMEREEYYNTEDGFRSSLVGCYMKLKNRSLYGEQLTMSGVEFMAQFWQASSQEQTSLTNFDYETTVTESKLKEWYLQLYKVIAQANDLLDYLDKKGDVIESAERRDLIRGEALAIRAFCHFDILRLFGQLPENATITCRLPYQEKADNKPVAFYDFEAFGQRVLKDFADAANLLKKSDPVTLYSFEALNDPTTAIEKGYIKDDFDAFRRVRFNYWAVKGLQARTYLYLADKTNAYTCAMEVINGQIAGKPVAELSCIDDYGAGLYVTPGEVLTGLNIPTISDYIPGLFRNDGASLLYRTTDDNTILRDLFAGQSSDTRFLNLWTGIQGNNAKYYTIKKYWQSSTGVNNDNNNAVELDMDRQMVPLIRLAEMYLIAAESASTVTEGNRLFRIFKTSRNLEYNDLTEKQLKNEILNEYRRELYAEGQMFFTYKRTGAKYMLWRSAEITEENYVLPLPKSEIEY